MKNKRLISMVSALLILIGCGTTQATKTETVESAPKIKALLIDGQNNHKAWPKTTFMMKAFLEDTNLFEVDIYRTEKMWRAENHIAQYPLNDGKNYVNIKGDSPVADANFKPNFEKYDVVVSNFGWKTADWPESTQRAFETYMKNGGGFVAIHAANNAFPKWDEYNKMTALGGWGGRNEESGPYIYFDDNGKLIRDTKKGGGGAHGTKYKFVIDIREPSHPITAGLPASWLHSTDELYAKLRGPAENLTVLASAYADKSERGSGRHEPVLMTIDYHKGRVFHSTLGHDERGFAGVGFITTFTRGTEWAATGKVTIPVPTDFPTKDKSVSRDF